VTKIYPFVYDLFVKILFLNNTFFINFAFYSLFLDFIRLIIFMRQLFECNLLVNR